MCIRDSSGPELADPGRRAVLDRDEGVRLHEEGGHRYVHGNGPSAVRLAAMRWVWAGRSGSTPHRRENPDQQCEAPDQQCEAPDVSRETSGASSLFQIKAVVLAIQST